MESQAASVTIKPIVFNPAEALAWFKIMEAQFALSNITVSSTRFHHALSALPGSVVMCLDDDIIEARDYDKLKIEVLEQTMPNRAELFDQFLQNSPLAGRPSQHLQTMKRLAQQVGASEEMVRHKFQKSLPAHVALMLATQKTSSLEEIGRLADELIAISPVQHTQEVQESSLDVDVIRRPTKTTTSLEPFTPDQRPKVCRAHIYFGPEAKSCCPWCLWPDKRGVRITQSRNSSPMSRKQVSEN